MKKKNTVTGKLEELENQIYHLTRDNWVTHQRKCPWLSGIIERLEETKSENQTPPHKIIDGILYFVPDEHKHLIEVPDSMIISVLDIEHNSYLAGHPGQQRLEHRVREKFTFPKINKLTTEFADRCQSCLLIKGRNPPPCKNTGIPNPCPTIFQNPHGYFGSIKEGFPHWSPIHFGL